MRASEHLLEAARSGDAGALDDPLSRHLGRLVRFMQAALGVAPLARRMSHARTTGVSRRLPTLLIALLALHGLLVQQAIPVTHEHDGGSDPHQHADLLPQLGPAHAHDADGRDIALAGHGDPADQDRLPDDDESHRHDRQAQIAALRRMTPVAVGAAELRNVLLSRLMLAHEQSTNNTIGQPPALEDGRGWLQPGTGRTIDRLVQGIGLLL